jgi:hypothetical protein
VKRIAIILAACALMSGESSAEPAVDRQRSAWPDEQEDRTKRPLAKWLPSVLPSVLGGRDAEPATEASDAAPAAEPAPQPRRQQTPRRAAEPQPEPEPTLTRKQQETVDRWWSEVGDAAVARFSRCLQEHAIDETTRGNQSSYPDLVTTAMNSRCSREFAAMAQVILDFHGEDNFARIARKLIATTFVPAVRQVVEGGPSQMLPPADERPTLEAEMRQAKDAMLSCLEAQADRLAAASAAPPEDIADRVVAACEEPANVFFAKLEELWPGTMAGEKPAAVIAASYRPAVIQRIASLRGDSAPAAGSSAPQADSEAASVGKASGGKADAETMIHSRQEATSYKSPDEILTPPAAPVQMFPAPASSRP